MTSFSFLLLIGDYSEKENLIELKNRAENKNREFRNWKKEQNQKMADYRGGGLTNMKIREAEKLVENIRQNVEQKKKEAEGTVSNFLVCPGRPTIDTFHLCAKF